MDERAYWVAWSRLPGIAGRRILALQEHFGTLSKAWESPLRDLACVPGIGLKLATEVATQRKWRTPADEWISVDRPPVQVITWLDDSYPAPLRDLSDPPAVLYVLGTLPDWSRAVAIVGNRDASPYGLKIATRFGRELAELGAVVISGVAAGIDRAAHEGALSVPDGLTVGVLGCGFHHVFPASNRTLYRAIADRGALLSEFPPDTKPMKGNFPYRNRLISGLSRGVMVVEAKLQSGSLITVGHALEQGRQVFAVPGPIDSPGSAGPHELINQGARLTTCLADLLQELGWEKIVSKAEAMALSEDAQERAIQEHLALGAKHIDAIALQVGLPAGQLGGLLMVMTLKGLVRSLPGQHYERV
jgi:DNA processing protein